MRMKEITLLILIAVLILSLACGALFATGEVKADMNGKIVGVCTVNPQDANNTDNTTCNSILVEGVVSGDSETHNISVKISPETAIFQKQGKERINASFNDFKPGQKVAVMFTGPFLQSHPPQTMAREIVIIPE